jgi:DNA-binding response OmpR family regulator
MSINAAIISENMEERMLLTQVMRMAGLSVWSDENFDKFTQSELENPVDLLILAPETAMLQEAVRQARLFSSAPMIVVADFIHDDTRVRLYDAGADLVLVRPYSPRLLMVQAGMMAQRDATLGLYQPFQRPLAAASTGGFIPSVRSNVTAPLYS